MRSDVRIPRSATDERRPESDAERAHVRAARSVDVVDTELESLEPTHAPGMMVTFDNTARRQWRPDLFTGSNPYTYRRWLAACIAAVADRPEDERLVFVNAWNEWAESAVLEPTEQFGRTYLLATRSANGA